MARRKQATPLKREPSDFDRGLPESPSHGWKHRNGQSRDRKPPVARGDEKLPVSITDQAGPLQLVICVGGIYASFLSWAVLQERITTTPYGPPSSPARFTYSIVLNTIQSTFAAISGYLYLLISNRQSKAIPAVFPTTAIIFPLVLVAVTSSLASPFGYASLGHIDYITFILAKSCKLLPVMFLHLTIFRKRYPLYKYLVVALVTAGVAVFTLHNPSSKKKSSSAALKTNSAWGLLLLSINLLFDGLTNSTQDHIFATFRPYTGPQMMVAQNLLSTILTVGYLFVSPYLPPTLSPSPNELSSAASFIRTHPAVGTDILGFCLCGAVGQIFIYYTLSQFSSLLLVTVTVTRKMLTMMLSVLWFGHRLSGMQWVGVGLVFGGVGAEGWIARREKAAKERAKREKTT
ncbi:MAG: UDP-galactose transporter [Heterodermia speciosa]|uniref:UDP-galactose transporter homolog 1 n=1 Tax=Heterodermia speciosa TaxID=116794 RepID=A0A8H3I8K5_9LECA|nr:MAG: UDP-galactose transporter [Heterodermia speciosa]